MKLSSRWCVTAVVALGALSCSDPVPPAAQGAFIVNLSSVSPPVNGKACPSSAASTFDVPGVQLMPTEILTENTYLHSAVDGESGNKVSCSVKGNGSFTFSGRISYGSQLLEVSEGVLPNNQAGTARITVANGALLSSALQSPAADCTIKVVSNSRGIQVKAGSLWATFSCASVEHQPSDSCGAKGVFVLENCTE